MVFLSSSFQCSKSFVKSETQVQCFANLLQQCHAEKNLSQAKQIHSQIIKTGYEDRFLQNLLVQVYGSCGSLEDATRTFKQIVSRNVFSWTILTTAYIQAGDVLSAEFAFQRMPQHNVVCSTAMVTAYAQTGYVDQAIDLFRSMKHKNVFSWTTIMSSVGQGRSVRNCLSVFNRMPERDPFAWNVMLAAYAENGHFSSSKQLFDEMPQRTDVTWNTLLDSGARSWSVEFVRECFELMPKRSTVSWNTMTVVYAHDGDVPAAKLSFEKTPFPDAISYNAMVLAYSRVGDVTNAKETFDRTPCKDLVSWNALVSTYAYRADVLGAQDCFKSMPELDSISFNALVMAYSRAGDVETAALVFNELPYKDLASWTALVSAYAHNGQVTCSLHNLRLMDMEGFQPEYYTYSGFLEACAATGALSEGRVVHKLLEDTGLASDTGMATLLLHMYGKCGCLREAAAVFDDMSEIDLIAWTSIISAYAQNGQGDAALGLFQGMSVQGVEPDEVTFVSIISACSHEGLLKDGRLYFHAMVGDYSITAALEHYKCVIDLLGRAGKLELAQELLYTMPYVPDVGSWTTLLSACKSHGNVELGNQLSRDARELYRDCESGAVYVLHANLTTTTELYEHDVP